METAIKHPQAPQKIIIVAIAEIIIFRGAQWRGCGNRTATLDRERNVVPLFLRDEVERRARSVKRRGKYKNQPFFGAFLDLGQSSLLLRSEIAVEKYQLHLQINVLIYGKRRRREWCQPRWLCEGATAEKIRGDRHNTAGMQ
jgi:hypothetical protein